MTKTVLESKFTEKKGLNRIEHIVNEMKCLFRVIHQDDYGIDGEIEVVVAKSSGNGYETKGGIIKVQAKAGKSYVKKDKADSFATPVRIDDLEYWNSLPFPVFFIVYHPEDDVLYFKEVHTSARPSTYLRLPSRSFSIKQMICSVRKHETQFMNRQTTARHGYPSTKKNSYSQTCSK